MFYEDTPEGDQAVMPGCERTPLREALERRMEEPKRANAMTPDALPLFDQAPTVDLEDYIAGLERRDDEGAGPMPADPEPKLIEEADYDPSDPLAIPPFLRRERGTAPKPGRQIERTWWMPPKSLTAVNRAVRDGCDTMQQIKKRLKSRFDDKDIRASLQALIDSGEVRQRGRRYEHTRGAK